MIKVFLSASVPMPGRDPEFLATADVIAIRESIKALVGEILPHGQIVFGGHPAITPLMSVLLENLGSEVHGQIVLYHSELFTDQFLPESRKFLDLRIVPQVGRSRKRSLEALRKRMISDTSFDVGVFIGGMEGVIEEFELFRSIHPHATLWPIASTGAAAQKILEQSVNVPNRDLLRYEITYPSLFRELVSGLAKS